MYALTLWPSLYDLDRHSLWQGDWPAVVKLLSIHKPIAEKAAGKGFGPYALTSPLNGPCLSHRGGPRPGAHRCDSCVPNLTLAVYDADVGAIEPALLALTQAGVAWLVYTTYSHTPEHSAWRLVLPLSAPVGAGRWQGFRRSVLFRFGIPADPSQCSGRSHFYYLPACPMGTDGTVRAYNGQPLDVGAYGLASDEPQTHAPAGVVELGETQATEVQEGYRRVLRDKSRCSTPAKAEYLRRLLAGDSLADHGGRNHAALITSAVVVAALAPLGATPATVCALLAPSIQASMAKGSTTDQADVEHMVMGIYAKRAVVQAELESWRKALWGVKTEALSKRRG